MNYAIIENDKVINIAVGPDDWTPAGMQAVPAGEGCVIGSTCANGVFTPPAPPPPPVPTLAEAQTSKMAELSAACQADIYAGFHSSALGADYLYPFKDTDQRNLSDSVLASTLPGRPDDWATPFWCADAAGSWAFRPHTAAQIQQVGDDAMARKLTCIEQNTMLAAQVNACTDQTAVEAVVWVSPT